ncbi:alpha/beta fold hydrolase [Actinoplanes sp. NPDC020271]|uniref:alpha/beta fold hydrolase n=1 Tax=Actinoplanes sp. NPDC020271 TaxID=3363896 RepID=UPI0037BDEFA4
MSSSRRPGTHSFQHAGIRQVYHVAGAGPVLIAHAGGPGVEYTYLRSPELEKHFTMVYPEPVGTGTSGRLPDGATYVETYAEFLAALIEHLGEPKVHLLGHSHGGLVAMRYAIDHPERVAGLALYSATPTTDAEFRAAEQALALAYADRHPDVPEAAGLLDALGTFGDAGTDEAATEVLRLALPLYFADFWGRETEFHELRSTVRAWATSFPSTRADLRPELPSITAPTVVIVGRHDFICGPVWAGMIHRGVPGSQLVILENSGHFGQIEEPGAYVEAVTRLLRDAAGGLRTAFRQGDTDRVVRLAEAELERARAAADPAGVVEALYALARVALRGDDLTRAEQLAATALAVAIRAGDRRLEERPRHVLAAVARLSGDYERALGLYRAGIELNEALGQPELVNAEYHNLAFTELHLGRLDRARELFEAGRDRVFREGWDAFVPYLGVAAAALASAETDHARAARMIGLADRAYAVVGQVPDPDDAQELSRARAAAVTALGQERFDREYALGAARRPEDALEYTAAVRS